MVFILSRGYWGNFPEFFDWMSLGNFRGIREKF
jgi:hypothetical protein